MKLRKAPRDFLVGLIFTTMFFAQLSGQSGLRSIEDRPGSTVKISAKRWFFLSRIKKSAPGGGSAVHRSTRMTPSASSLINIPLPQSFLFMV